MKLHVLCAFCVFVVLSPASCNRLPPSGTVRPVTYDLVLLPLLTGDNPRLCGHLWLEFEARSDSNVIRLHGVDLDLLDASIELLSAANSTDSEGRFQLVEDVCFAGLAGAKFVRGSNGVELFHHRPDDQQWEVIVSRTFTKGKTYRLGLLYTGKIYQGPTGFFRSSYTQCNGCCESWFGGTQMEATHARKVLPCLDEPEFKATFRITLGHEHSHRALSNMREDPNSIRPMSSAPGWFWTSFEESPPMSTYLLAMVVTDYDHVERLYKVCDRTVAVRVWAKKHHLDYVNETAEIIPRILRYLELQLGHPFPLPKIDFISPPSALPFLGMENWGLVLLMEGAIYHDRKADSEKDRHQGAQIIAHELAHQFFGDLVTPDWWSRVWIYEGFSVLFEHDSVRESFPELADYADDTFIDGIHSVMKQENPETRSVDVQVQTEPEIDRIFDEISYNKGTALLRMAQNIVGRNVFRQGLSAFIQRYQFRNANDDQLWQVFDELLAKQDHLIRRQMNVSTVMKSWTSRNGYPIVDCSRNSDGNAIRLSQRSLRGHSDNRTWWIPIALTDQKRADFTPFGTFPRLWITPQRPTLEVAVHSLDNLTWVVLNGEMSGYYRVRYDRLNYQLLGQQLLNDYSVIPGITRVQLISDAFTLAEMDLLDYEEPLRLIAYLKVFRDEFVLPTAVGHLNRMKELCNDLSHIDVVKEYIKEISRGSHSLSRMESSNPYDRISAAACDADDRQCVKLSLQLFGELMKDTVADGPSAERATADQFPVVWCTALKHGGAVEWKFAWERSIDPRWERQRAKILAAMACSRQVKHVKQLLSRVFHPTRDQQIEASQTVAMIESLTDNPIARPMTWQFIEANWEALKRRLGHRPDAALKLIAQASRFMKTREELKEVKSFLRDKQIGAAQLSAVLNAIENNIQWAEEKHSERVMTSLTAILQSV